MHAEFSRTIQEQSINLKKNLLKEYELMNLTLPNNVSQRVFLKVLSLNLILQFHQTGFKDKPTPIMLVFLLKKKDIIFLVSIYN